MSTTGRNGGAHCARKKTLNALFLIKFIDVGAWMGVMGCMGVMVQYSKQYWDMSINEREKCKVRVKFLHQFIL